jgi:DNA-binding CsgD family transcriptional regulator
MLISDEAFYAVASGDWDSALKLVQEARGESVWTAGLQFVEALIQAGREGPERALPLLDAARGRLREASASHKMFGASVLARTALLAGDARGTLDDLEGVVADVGRGPFPELDEAAVCAVAGAITQKDSAALGRWIEVALVEEHGARRISGRARRAFARAERAANAADLDTAIRLQAESADLFNQSLLPFGETLARRRRVELLVRRNAAGDREAAQAEVATILPYWRKAKARWFLGQLRLWSTELGLDLPEEVTAAAPSPIRAARTHLTAREREVAALVAAGLSNKEIAEKLVIGERTAEGHVERILGKLGFRSRSQIASWHAGGDPIRTSS